jgi:hypothetical protein
MGVRQDFARVPLIKSDWQQNGDKKSSSKNLLFSAPLFLPVSRADGRSLRFAKV